MLAGVGAGSFAAGQTSVEAVSEPEPVSFQVYLWPQDDPAAGFSAKPGKRLTPAEAQMFPVDEEAAPYEPPAVAYRADGAGNLTDMTLYEGRLSPVFSYRGPEGELAFIEPPEAGAEMAEPVPLGRVKLPVGEKRLILIFFPQADGTYRIIPVKASPKDVPAGHAILINLTRTPLGCSLGGSVFEMDSGAQSLQSLIVNDSHMQMMLLASRDRNGNWRRQHFNKYHVDSQDRLLFVIYNPAGHTSHFKVEKLDLNVIAR